MNGEKNEKGIPGKDISTAPFCHFIIVHAVLSFLHLSQSATPPSNTIGELYTIYIRLGLQRK